MNVFYERILCCQGRRAGKHLKAPGTFLLCDLRLSGSDLYQPGDRGMQWCQTSPPRVVDNLMEKTVNIAECCELLLQIETCTVRLFYALTLTLFFFLIFKHFF